MKSLLMITILLIAVSVSAEEKEISWDSPPADYHRVEIAEFMGFEGQIPIWASEMIPSTDRSIDVDLDVGVYMITITSCLEGVCMPPSEPRYIECVEWDRAYNIKIDGEYLKY